MGISHLDIKIQNWLYHMKYILQ